MTAHWIDGDFKLNEALLCFEKLTGTHSGQRMAEKLFGVLEDFDITSKLFCITTDAASNNTTLVKSLSEILLDEKGIEWDWEKMHINCLDHVINVAVQAFLRSIKVVSSTDDEEDGDVDGVDVADGSFVSTLSKIRRLAKVSILQRANTVWITILSTLCTLHVEYSHLIIVPQCQRTTMGNLRTYLQDRQFKASPNAL
jgi:hypothetical protein